MRSLSLLLAAAFALPACGDNIEPGTRPDAEPDEPDAEIDPPDALFCAPRAMGEIGGPCTIATDCESAAGAGDGYCYVGSLGNSTFAPEGYCTREDQTGFIYCDTDAECGDGSVCVNNRVGTDDYKFCLPACDCEGDTCPVNQACFNSFNGAGLDKTACVPGDADADDGDPCAGFYECNIDSNCFADNYEFPGGQCSAFQCTLGDDTTCHGGHCVAGEVPFEAVTRCVDTCTTSVDCRGTEGYVCFDPDGAGTEPNYCRHPHIGDACTAAADCGNPALFNCRTAGDGFLGGYCTAATACATPGTNPDCTQGSICHDPLVGNNYCADRCPNAGIGTQSTCRTGYTCVDTHPAGGETFGGCVPIP